MDIILMLIVMVLSVSFSMIVAFSIMRLMHLYEKKDIGLEFWVFLLFAVFFLLVLLGFLYSVAIKGLLF